MAGMLHDVGKVGIADMILKKPTRLTDEEFQVMKQHTIAGACLFEGATSDLDIALAEVALNHHERRGRKGYPGYVDIISGKPLAGYEIDGGRALGKEGENIPLFGRIVCIADVYDALCSWRSYKDPWKEEDVFEELQIHVGRMFDPELINIFFDIQDVIQTIKQRYPGGLD
jgi:response regulator RpfG family c-di-GMP phosphodiesterase